MFQLKKTKMAKFEDYLQGSALTWSTLGEGTNKKIDAFEKTYEAYSNAYDAKDNELASKYEKDLETLDAEIISAIKSDESKATPKKVDSPQETPPIEKAQVIPQTSTEQGKTAGEEVKEANTDEPKKEESSGGKTYIGMFEV